MRRVSGLGKCLRGLGLVFGLRFSHSSLDSIVLFSLPTRFRHEEIKGPNDHGNIASLPRSCSRISFAVAWDPKYGDLMLMSCALSLLGGLRIETPPPRMQTLPQIQATYLCKEV